MNNLESQGLEEQGFEVWVRVNEKNEIIEVNSNIFIKDFTGWILIDKNVMGDKGAHAQSQYFDKPIIDENGKYTYYLKGGKVYGN